MCLFSRHRLLSQARSGPQHLDRALSTALSPKSGDKLRFDEHAVMTHCQHQSLFSPSLKVDQTVDPQTKHVGEISFAVLPSDMVLREEEAQQREGGNADFLERVLNFPLDRKRWSGILE